MFPSITETTSKIMAKPTSIITKTRLIFLLHISNAAIVNCSTAYGKYAHYKLSKVLTLTSKTEKTSIDKKTETTDTTPVAAYSKLIIVIPRCNFIS